MKLAVGSKGISDLKPYLDYLYEKEVLEFFAPENMKKPPSYVTNNQPRPFFFSTGLTAQMAQKQKSHTTKSPLMQN